MAHRETGCNRHSQGCRNHCRRIGCELDELLDDRAMLEEIERQREETGLLMDLGRRLQGSNARRNNPSSPKYLVGPDGLVPPWDSNPQPTPQLKPPDE